MEWWLGKSDSLLSISPNFQDWERVVCVWIINQINSLGSENKQWSVNCIHYDMIQLQARDTINDVFVF